ncbi:MAG TPA: flagellar filament outer layer protein FlaA [Armatimonadota bacterium]|nr:flagellar filament outer layer protein FlaA [Armatimonadota bacterium]
MKLGTILGCAALLATGISASATTVTLQDYETPIGIGLSGQLTQPECTLSFGTDKPYEGKHDAEVYYRMAPIKGIQTVTLDSYRKIYTPIHRISVAVRGNNDPTIVLLARFADAKGETFQYFMSDVKFTGWRVLSVDMDTAKPGIWGGDGNQTMDYPLTFQCFVIDTIRKDEVATASQGTLAFDATTVESDKSAAETLGPQRKPVCIQDFEQTKDLTIFGQLLQPESKLTYSTEKPYEGKQCLDVHYKFAPVKGIQTVLIDASYPSLKAMPHAMAVAVRGDKSNCPLWAQFSDANGETFQYRVGTVDFNGWRIINLDMDANKPGHWGGDNDGIMQAPIKFDRLVLDSFRPKDDTATPAEGDIAFDSIYVMTD